VHTNVSREVERARMLLAKARERAPTQKIWMKSAILEREEGALTAALTLLDTALQRYPTFDKLYMMAAQCCVELALQTGSKTEPKTEPSSESQKLYERARGYYQSGLRRCPMSVTLWQLAALLEEEQAGVNKARSMLELARLRNPK
jgi:pre-mRNA-processing factor 6